MGHTLYYESYLQFVDSRDNWLLLNILIKVREHRPDFLFRFPKLNETNLIIFSNLVETLSALYSLNISHRLWLIVYLGVSYQMIIFLGLVDHVILKLVFQHEQINSFDSMNIEIRPIFLFLIELSIVIHEFDSTKIVSQSVSALLLIITHDSLRWRHI